MAGNFRGRKVLRIVKILLRKLSRNAKPIVYVGMARPKFHGENFRRWLSNCEIRECFFLESFPSIWYYASAGFHVCWPTNNNFQTQCGIKQRNLKACDIYTP